MTAVGLVTTDPEGLNGEDLDLPILVRAFEANGIVARAPIWHDPEVDWSCFDLVVMRSPWDYTIRLNEFLGWLSRVAHETVVLNCPDVIRWDLDKSYLLDLERQGVPIVPTKICSTLDEVVSAVATFDADRLVIKPNISVGSQDTGRFVRTDSDLTLLASRILDEGKKVLVEPDIPSVAITGEHSLVYFDGQFSHALYKAPILALGGGYVGGRYIEDVGPAEVTRAERDVADLAMHAIRKIVVDRAHSCADPTPLYARFDLVRDDDEVLLMEAELFEPSYFLSTSRGADLRFVDAVRRRLDCAER